MVNIIKDSNKIKKNEDFRIVYKYGQSMANKLLIIYFMKKDNYTGTRVGFTVSKKVGKSVVRSRVKRLMKEAYRLNSNKIKEGYDIVFIARNGCREATYKEVESATLHLLRKLKLLKL